MLIVGKAFLNLTVLGVTGLLAQAGYAQQPEAEENPQETLLYIATHTPHGSRAVSDEVQAMLDRVRADPARYAPYLPALVSVPQDLNAWARWDDVTLVSSGLALAQLMGRDHSETLVARFFADLSRAMRDHAAADPEWVRGRASRNAMLLGNGALDVLAGLGSDSAVTACLESLESGDPASDFVTLRYLAKVARGRADVKERLAKMLEDPNSRQYHDSDLRRTIVELDQPPASQPTTQPAGTQPSTAPTAADLERMLADAKAAWSRKDYTAAERLGQDVLQHPQATDEQRRQAQLILDRVAQDRGAAPASQPAAPPTSQPAGPPASAPSAPPP